MKEIIIYPRLKRNIISILPYFLILFTIACTLLPIMSMVFTSLKSPANILSSKTLLPKEISFHYYINVLSRSRFLVYLGNSFFIAISVSVCSTLISILGGYSLSRYSRKVKGLRYYIIFLLALQMFPLIQIIVPLYLTFQRMGITNTRISVMIAYLTFTLPLNIWMMQSFFEGVPIEIDEAGTIDGCGRLECLFRLIIPVSGPGLAAVSIFTFNFCWNEYLLGSLLLKTDSIRTLTIGLQSFMQEHTTDWGSLMAASTLAIIPVLVFLVFMQKYIVIGITAGSVKG